jgi:predicted enzyme related to lactoylglutathione lyase
MLEPERNRGWDGTMMKILEFAFIAYPVTDESRARAFYEGILGLAPAMEMRDGDQFWIEYEVGPHVLGIGNEPFMTPSSNGAQLVLEVADFDEAIAHLKSHGVVFAMEPFVMPHCRAAIIHDPDDNRLGIHQRNG